MGLVSGVWKRMDELEKDGVFEGVGIGVFNFGGAWSVDMFAGSEGVE